MAHRSWFPAIVLCLASLSSAKPVNDDVTDIELRMPNVQPKEKDTYLCIPMKMGEDATYLTGFVPHADMNTAHHILLFGCENPGKTDGSWNCGEMQAKAAKGSAPPCASEPKIIYAWAMDAPELKLPEGVGFKVGGESNIHWLVLQVHYKDVSHFLPPESGVDNSGLTLHSTKTPQPKRAGVYLLSTGGEIPAHSTTYMEAACGINDVVPVHPFAFRVHAHTHGQVVSGYRVRDGEWTELGRQSPKQPQMFYNVTHPGITLQQGDILAARCTMVNDEDQAVDVGPTQQDEMCNFYLMYWMPGDETMTENYCTTAGPPSWYWSSLSTIHTENSPGDVSMIPGTGKILKATAKFAQHVENAIEDTHQNLQADFQGMMDAFQGNNYNNNDLESEIERLMRPNMPFDLENEMERFRGHPAESLRDMLYRVSEDEGSYPGLYEENERPYYPRY